MLPFVQVGSKPSDCITCVTMWSLMWGEGNVRVFGARGLQEATHLSLTSWLDYPKGGVHHNVQQTQVH